MEYTAENLEKAVTLFYRSEAGQQAEAHQWLTEAQNSPQAWSFVWELLSPHRNSEIQFFAATTLHMKLMKHWNELPEDHYEILKKRILEAIINYAMGPKIVLNRLCITLSAYVIHTVPIHWPNAFEELVASFQPHHLPNVEPERVIWILLEILTMIPEEFQSTILAASHKMRVRNVLQEVSKDILKVVEMCLMPIPSAGFDMSNLTTYYNASRCASAWIQLGGLNIDECTTIMNLLINLTCFTYWNKTDPDGIALEEMDLIEATMEALIAIIQHPHTIRYKNHVIKASAEMLYKFEKILDCERDIAECNKDLMASLYGLLITLADSHSKIFINNLKSESPEEQRISFDLFNCVLKCTNLPGLYPVDESSSTLTFGFWYTLQDEILSLDTAECAQLLLMIKPYYRDLVCVMLRKSMYPLNETSEWSLDDKEVFRCYRQDIADTFMYCYNVLNLEMLDILNGKLVEALRKNVTSTTPVQWNEVETCLHAFGAIAESIEMENLYLPKLMVTIKEIPYADLHKKVMASALETVGSYSDWITERPDMLENVLPLVVSALDKPEVATSATMALKDLTHSCQKYMLPYADHIMIAAQSALLGGNLKLPECTRLMFSIGKVLSVLPADKIMNYLNIILAPSFKELQELLNSEPSAALRTPIITRLKILSALFNSLCIKKPANVEQPTVLVMRNTMPLYKIIGEKYSDSLDVMEELSVLFKYVVTALLDDCTTLINDILQLVVSIYRRCPQANMLMVAKTVVIMFGDRDEFRAITHQLLHEIVSTTLQMCAQVNSTNQLSEKTDVLEGFFGMMGQLFKKLPDVVFSSGIDTAALFQCAVLCLSLSETQTLKVCAIFLVNFIAHSRDTAQANIVQTYGESLVLRILVSLGSVAPRSSVDVFSDLLLALNKKYCDNLSRWLNTLLAQDDFPSARISKQQKERFIKLVLREKANKRKLCDSVLEFTLICRGILREDTNMP